MRHCLFARVGSALLIAACGGAGSVPAAPATAAAQATPAPAATPAPQASAAPTAAATARPTAPPVARVGSGSPRYEVLATSKATVRVREQLAGVSAPNDAVLSTSAVSGAFELQADGTFTPDSKIVVDLTTLQSDERRRDDFIKGETLETRRFPRAEFVPLRTTGLPVPLPAAGAFTFKIVGKMTIRGVEKELTFDATAERRGGDLTAIAKVAPSIKFADFGMTRPRVFTVLTIEDDIRLELQIAAREIASG